MDFLMFGTIEVKTLFKKIQPESARDDFSKLWYPTYLKYDIYRNMENENRYKTDKIITANFIYNILKLAFGRLWLPYFAFGCLMSFSVAFCRFR